MPLYVLFCMQDTFVGQLRGVGYSLLPTITSLSGICLLRVVWLYTAFAASPTLDTLYLSYPVSWAATLFALVVCYACLLYTSIPLPTLFPCFSALTMNSPIHAVSFAG